MTLPVRRLPGLIVAMLAAFGMAALSRAPLTAYPEDTPVARLAWSVRPERIERCRTLSDAELAEVPAHMRQRVQCEGQSATYRLSASVDGVTRLDTLVTGGGARNDRPVYVFREFAVAPGHHALTVEFVREPIADRDTTAAGAGEEVADDSLMAGRAAREAEERSRRQGEAVAPRTELVTEVEARPREVLLVTYDIDRRALVLRTRTAPR